MAITVRVCVQVGAPELYGFRSKLFFFTLNRQAMWAGLQCAPVSKIAGKADREKLRRNRAGPRERRRSGAFQHVVFHTSDYSGIPASGIAMVGQF